MRTLFGIVLAGGLMIAASADAKAQIVVGNPWMGRGVYVGGNPYAYGMPMTGVYSSGYVGVAPGLVGPPLVRPPVVYGYGYPAYRYGYGYGYRRFGPYGWNRGFYGPRRYRVW